MSQCQIYNLSDATFAKVKEAEQHQEVQVIKIDENGEKCAVGFGHGIIYLYLVAEAKQLGKLRGHDGDIQSFLFTQNRLISTAKDRTIKVWNVDQSKCVQSAKLPKASGYKSKRFLK